MAQPTDNLAGLERQRLQLEESILELRKSLYNWRMWDAEYDELKNDISALEENSKNEDFLRIGREFGGSLVNEHEIEVLLGVKQRVTRTKQQVVDAISRRMDYVQQNIGVLEKRISAAERKLDAILTVQHPGAVDEDGLPITDIVEELDEDDRVISSSTTTPDQAAPGILEALKKAGMDLPREKSDDTAPLADESRNEFSRQKDSANPPDISPRIGEIPSTGIVSNTKLDTTTTVAKTAPSIGATTDSATRLSTNSPPVGVVDNNRSSAPEISYGDGDESTNICIDESPEDAALRREMLQYGLEEVGAVVAELELDESGSEFSIEDEDYVISDEDDEEEDEYGRSTRRMIDDDYRRQMMELEKKLNARSLENVGPDTSVLPPDVRKELDSPIPRENIPNDADSEAPKQKKKVAFADALDIAPQPNSPIPPARAKEHRIEPPSVPVVQDAIVERAQGEKICDTNDTTTSKKMSRFKSASQTSEPINLMSTPTLPAPAVRSSAPSIDTPPLPLFPAKPSQPKPFSQPITNPDQPLKTLADELVERTVSYENATPPDPDELDESLHKREIATEFYKFRNRKIHQEGGFLREDEESNGIIPLEEDGQPAKKLSRFLAARMK
ncbi:prefoldin superfamily domain-containing protein [Histoplasma capsulatum]|uniref:Prefoldin superfamily domain-containing protein n=1 Tax=Ajellomyces capsulatus TaxID=5037 RepID=A0A8A1MEC2_AJECA|nr:prefoldin superfamily domain-containing protein [Histoplasma capsulatum]